MAETTPTLSAAQLRKFGRFLLGNAVFLTIVIVGAALLSGRYLLLILLAVVAGNVYFAVRQFAQARQIPQ